MIVARGLGRNDKGSIVASGLGIKAAIAAAAIYRFNGSGGDESELLIADKLQWAKLQAAGYASKAPNPAVIELTQDQTTNELEPRSIDFPSAFADPDQTSALLDAAKELGLKTVNERTIFNQTIQALSKARTTGQAVVPASATDDMILMAMMLLDSDD